MRRQGGDDYTLILFKYYPNKLKTAGWWEEDAKDYIFVNKRLSRITRKIILAHEEQHRKCYFNKCKCSKNDYLSEYHAYKAEFQYILDINKHKYWKAYFKNALDCLDRYITDKSIPSHKWHLSAFKKFSKTKQFRKWAEKYGYLKAVECRYDGD